jgi:hypothetical protein
MKANKIYHTFFLLCITLSLGAQCLETTHTPFEEDSWLSCQKGANPNPEHPNSHWIMYDLGYEYVLDSTHFWNYNVWANSDAGARDVVIDYSQDGTTWETLTTFILDKAPASYKYEGVAGPNFNGVTARYVLITALNNWGDGSCTGISEVRIGVEETIVNVEPEIADQTIKVEVSPNPAIDEAVVSIQASEFPSTVGLYDLAGRLIQVREDPRIMNITFDLESLPGGIYFVKAAFEDAVVTQKLIKL